jgi:ferrous iron transport protein A
MQLHNHSIPLMFVGQGEVSVVADSGSALMVAVGDTRMALGYPLAQALLVAVLEKGSSR